MIPKPRAKKDPERDYLVLSEVLTLEPPEDYKIRMSHIGNLFVMDSDRNGRFHYWELEEFAKYCRDESKSFKGYEFNFQLQAQSTLLLWKELEEEGSEGFGDWIGKLLSENAGVEYFNISPKVGFVNIEAVKLLYDMMDMKMLKSFSLQHFFHLLQQSAEESNLMPLECDQLDNHIPLDICKEFSAQFFIGFSRLFKDIGLNKNMH